MQQTIGESPAIAARTLDSGTGPAAEATTGAVNCGIDHARGGDCSAELQVRVTHNRVQILATLNMGGRQVAVRTWERRAGSRAGWVLQPTPHGPEFVSEEERISLELAEFADSVIFPFTLANMLPGRKAAAAAVADAAQEVARA